MALSDTRVERATRKKKPYKLADADGLYLLVQPNGAKWWRFDYRFAGKRNTVSVGTYPDVSLVAARERHREMRTLLADGRDPSAARKAERRAERLASANTFEAVAREWLAQHKPPKRADLADRTRTKLTWLLEAFLFPHLGSLPIASIEPDVVLDALRRIENRGRTETAHRAAQVASAVFTYAIPDRAKRNPVADIRKKLKAHTTVSRAAVKTPAAVGALLRAIESFEGSPVVFAALRLTPFVFVRPGELRQAEWREFEQLDESAPVWRIPAEKMKSREEHLVPLSPQAVAILRELKPLTGAGRFVFPSRRTSKRPMSNNTLNAALRRLGYDKTEQTAHGFRTIASTRLNEMGWRPDVIERQLAHVDDNKVRAVYNRALYLPERREMMTAWADELDRLRVNVVSIQRAG